MEKKMNLDFTYQNPTTIHFGINALDNLGSELKNYGETIMLAYGNKILFDFLFFSDDYLYRLSIY
jgi:hypothetical protein